MPRSIRRGLETVGLYSNRHLSESLATKIRAAGHNLESLHLLPPLGLHFIPQTSFALSASAVRIILNDVVLHERRCVVELGAGMSTLYLSKILAEAPGACLVSIDHDSNWLDYVETLLKRIGTASVVRLVHAPLEPLPDAGDAPWYSTRALNAALAGRIVDSLIVDGPKARSANDTETRSHALPAIAPYLNPAGSAVFLDDIKRNGEREIFESWAREFAMTRVLDADFCGLGILVPRDRPLKFKIV